MESALDHVVYSLYVKGNQFYTVYTSPPIVLLKKSGILMLNVSLRINRRMS